jgi:hypothetical protein
MLRVRITAKPGSDTIPLSGIAIAVTAPGAALKVPKLRRNFGPSLP